MIYEELASEKISIFGYSEPLPDKFKVAWSDYKNGRKPYKK